MGRKDTVGGQDSMALIEEVSPGRTYTHGEFQIFFRNPDRPGGLNLIEKKKFQARCSVQIFFMHFLCRDLCEVLLNNIPTTTEN